MVYGQVQQLMTKEDTPPAWAVMVLAVTTGPHIAVMVDHLDSAAEAHQEVLEATMAWAATCSSRRRARASLIYTASFSIIRLLNSQTFITMALKAGWHGE